MDKHLIVLAGPTAVGKTELSISLAQLYNCPIISADSRQLYKLMNIGTAKPTSEEQDGIIHHFIDLINPDEIYTAGKFEKDALHLLDHLYKIHDVVILSGGTGLYIDAITSGLDEFPEIPLAIREKLNNELNELGLEILTTELKAGDPIYYDQVDLSNSRRVLRALEVIRTSNKPYSSFLAKEKKARDFDIHFIQLHRKRAKLYKRINTRVDKMIKNGLVEEVKSLLPFKKYSSLDTVGYREIFDYLEHKISLDEAIDEIKKHTRRFAKRQMTWYRRSDKWQIFHADEKENIVAFLRVVIPRQKEH